MDQENPTIVDSFAYRTPTLGFLQNPFFQCQSLKNFEVGNVKQSSPIFASSNVNLSSLLGINKYFDSSTLVFPP